ncbi:MAG TPA: O-antigen ligase family protein [Anaerolineales bacterium]|nr:O-antigen ligase family protein [Anaerolineales bacterium]HNQ95053.1 O-antigen ligase family protein [Anaerolineales bacterium]HNS61765.1 O-antigen ligase family protein [Anaerolineales bacterium]
MDSASPYPASHWTERLARSAFYATLILAPVRLRIVLQSRPSEAIYSDYTDFLLFLPDIALLVMLIAWRFAKRFNTKHFRFGPAFVWIPLAGLTASALISVASSADSALSLYHAIRLCLLFLFYLFIVNEQFSVFSIALAVGLQGALQTVIAIPQSILQRSLGLQAIGEYLLDPAWSGVSIISDGATRFLRAYGLSDHPNILGGCLAFSLLVLLTVYLRGERKNSLLLGIVFALLSLALLMTFSRSAWLAFAAGSVFIVWFEAKARGWAFFKPLALLFVCTVIVLIPFIVANSNYFGARFNAGGSFEAVRSERGAVEERLFLMASANHIFSKHPLTGVGMSASPLALRDEVPQLPETFNYQPPHFVLLTVGLETGMFGAIFYFLLMILPWVAFSRRADLRKNPHVIGAMGLLLAVTIVGFFDYYTWFSTPGRIWQWLAWGLVAVAIESPLRAERTLSERQRDEVVVEAGRGQGEDKS